MDSFEDASPRVLLRNVLYTEQPCSPITRSMSQQQSVAFGSRRSTRLRKSDAGIQSPQVALRQKLRQNLHKNISKSPLQQRKRSLSMSGMMGKVKMPAVTASHSLSEDVTPRRLLRGILQTEPELSLIVPDRPDSEETELCSTESSLCSNGPSMGISHMSNLELPDLPTVNLTMAIRGISRKRPKRNMNVSVFERKIVDQSGDGSGDGAQDATGNLSAMSGASNLSLSLKTPCVDLHTHRRGLQRNAGKRKAISVEDFEAGVHDLQAKKRNPDREQSLNQTAGMEKFTLGLSDATAWNLSSIIMSDTALYPSPVSGTTAHASIAIHDKDTVTSTQIRKDLQGGGGVGGGTQAEVEQEEMAVERLQQEDEEEVGRDASGDAAGGEGEKDYEEKMEEEDLLDQIEEEGLEGSGREGGDEEVKEGEGEQSLAGGDDAEMENAEEEVEEAGTVESEREAEEQGTELDEEEEAAVESEEKEDEVQEFEREEEEKDTAVESNREEEDGERGDILEDMEEGGAFESTETQEEEVVSGPEQLWGAEHVSRRAYRSEGVMKVSGMAAGGRGYKSLSTGLQPMDTESETQEEEGAAESETQEEEVVSGPEQLWGAEHVSRRAYRSEGVMQIPGVAAGGRGYKSLSTGLQPMDKDLESGEGLAELVKSSVAGASGEWHSGPGEGSLPPHSPLAQSPESSPASSPNEIPPSQELRDSGREKSLLEEEEGVEEEEEEEKDEEGEEEEVEEEEEEEKDEEGEEEGVEEEEEEEKDEEGEDEEEENMDGGAYADEPEDKENSIPLAQPGSPEISLFSPHTPHTSTRVEPHAGVSTAGELEPPEDDYDEGEEEEENLSESEELPLKTPAFVRERKRVLTPGPATTPNFLKQMMEARKPAEAAAPAAKPKSQRKGQAASSQKTPGLPKSYVMSTFKHFAKTKVSSDSQPILQEIMAKYFDRLADDLEAYATHAKRKTIEVEDVELLMRRQGFVTDSMPVNVLIEKYLPHEYRKLLIPCATSGNKIFPKQRKGTVAAHLPRRGSKR
ncbi:centromere protein T isoform X2 [Conger conger]|uniref:centromere protein T isoform X2 n=1 Tax=Conger conger TaxID=82655 RepID=UPI002A5ADCC3|nr:centromere protein T isoform X2 [Conger conger]